MAKREFSDVRIQTKRDTSANWEKNNPVLLNGEKIIVDTTAGEVREKIGDGSKTYSQLPFTDEALRTLIAGKVDKVSGKGLSTNDYTTTEKEKLANIEDKANFYVHPDTHAATMITQDTTHRFVTDAQITTWNGKASTSVASSTANGLMSKDDKTKLDELNNYSHPTYTAKTSGLYKITVDGTGHVSATSAVVKADITSLGIPAQDTTYSEATSNTDGLMSAEDKSKLDGIEANANKYIHPDTHAATMITQDATHRFVTDAEKAAWNAKASTAVATTSANGLMSSDDKSKLDGIEANANKYTHPTNYTAKSVGLYKIEVENTGHVKSATAVTKADITALGIPAQNTTYSAGTGLELNGTTFNHSNSIDAGTASEGGSTRTLDFGGTFKVPSVTYDAQGHITGKSNVTLTMPAKPSGYEHPTTHPATMITQDTNHRFVTDDQISEWDGKADASDLTSHTGNKSNPHGVTKSQVGLGNVTNDAQVKRTEMGAANGVATLDANGTIPSSQLPSYVDDVIEGYYHNSKFHTDSAHTTVITGESGKIYVDLHTSKTYRWSGSAYAVISETLALGETSSTAYPGSSGKANAAAIVTINEKLSTIEDGANKYTHPDTHAATMITTDSTHRFVTDAQISTWNAKASTAVATSTANGLMSSDMVNKLAGIEANANNYSHPTYTAKSSGLYKITVDGTGHVSATTAVAKADITALGIPGSDTNTTYDLGASASSANGNVKLNLTAGGSGSGVDSVSIKGSGATTVTTDANGVITISSTDNNTTYSNASTTVAGLMSATDKVQVDKIATLESKIAAIEEKLKTAVFMA